MPTTAQMHIDDVNNELLRQTLANQAALQQAKMQANAQQYLADKQYAATDLTSGRALEGNKYNADASLSGIDMQQAGQNYRTDAEQRGSVDRTRMMIEPQKMAQDLERQKYLNSMDYIKSAMLREALGKSIPPMNGGGQSPEDARMEALDNRLAAKGHESYPATSFNDYAAKNGLALTKDGNPPAKYDMTGFNKDVAGIAENIDAVRGKSPAMGPDDLPVATAWTPGASIMGADGVRRQVAFPPSALPKPMEKTAPADAWPIDGNPAKPAMAAPLAATTTTAEPPAFVQRLLGIQDPEAGFQQKVKEALVMSASQGNPRAIAALGKMDPKYADMFSADPSMQVAEAAKAASAGPAGIIADIGPELAKLDQIVASTGLMQSDESKRLIPNIVQQILDKAVQSGHGDQIPAIKDEIRKRLDPALASAGKTGVPSWIKYTTPWGALLPSAEKYVGGNTRSDLAAQLDKLLK